jgi:very-short-patch-repair endonuclease
MVDVINNTCLECNSRPCYNVEGETTAIYCAKHRKENMVNVVSPTCKTNLCSTIVQSNKYDGYCIRCFIHLFPDKPVSRNYKTKEQATVDFIKQYFPDKTIITDKQISGGCSKRRPDILIDFGEQIIIVEIDEYQHKSYDNCDNRRMMEISQDLGHRPVVFIRFNPDDYIDKNNTKIKSCWTTTRKTGLVKIDNKKIWQERLNVLKNQVKYWINNKTEKTVENIHLFYDEIYN